MRRALATSLLLVLGCDPQAKPAIATRADLLPRSRQHESCAATSDCEAPLRCVNHTCLAAQGSRLGEYYFASGQLAVARGEIPRAVEAFQQSLASWEADHLEPPPTLTCAYGSALERKLGDAKAAEQAARLLHRCLLSSAPGSTEHRAALDALAKLEPLGLDPALLARDTPADTYLTKPPQKPSADAVRLEVAPGTPARDKTYAAWVTALGAEDVRKAVAGCFAEYAGATQKPRLALTITFTYKSRFDPDEEIYLPGTLEPVPLAGLSGADDVAARCVTGALAPIAQAFSAKNVGGSWTGSVTLTLSAGS